MEDKIKANAELVLRQLGPLSGIDFGYNAQSVAWVDGFIENQRIRPDLDNNAIHGLVNTLGSFLGECIIHNFGGNWQKKDGEWCISFDEKNAAYPFNTVRKQFANGQENSIKKFFDLIPVLFKRQIVTPDQSETLEFPFLSASMPDVFGPAEKSVDTTPRPM
jgi:hypothetical protein